MTGPRGPYQGILPGLYLDQGGNAVFNAADILREMGMEDTPENRLELMAVLKELIQEQYPGENIIFRTLDDPTWRRLG
ncbi:MAG: hypothetical protein ACE5Q6_07615 [Dehalococcoidia bacterium]